MVVAVAEASASKNKQVYLFTVSDLKNYRGACSVVSKEIGDGVNPQLLFWMLAGRPIEELPPVLSLDADEIARQRGVFLEKLLGADYEGKSADDLFQAVHKRSATWLQPKFVGAWGQDNPVAIQWLHTPTKSKPSKVTDAESPSPETGTVAVKQTRGKRNVKPAVQPPQDPPPLPRATVIPVQLPVDPPKTTIRSSSLRPVYVNAPTRVPKQEVKPLTPEQQLTESLKLVVVKARQGQGSNSIQYPEVVKIIGQAIGAAQNEIDGFLKFRAKMVFSASDMENGIPQKPDNAAMMFCKKFGTEYGVDNPIDVWFKLISVTKGIGRDASPKPPEHATSIDSSASVGLQKRLRAMFAPQNKL